MTSTTSNDWASLAKRLDNIKKPVGTFKLCEDPDIRDRYLTAKRESEQAEAYVKTLSKDTDPEARGLVEKEAAQAKAELAAATKAYDTHTVTLRFTALERDELKDLLAKFPPTEQDEENGAEFAEDFMPVLISAASLDGMPVDDAKRYLSTWTPPDARDLWNAAWSIQHTRRTDLGKG